MSSIINDAGADAVNAVFRRIALPFRLENISAENARVQLEQNPALLSEYGLSQMMSGDIDDVTLVEAKGRPFANTLAERIRRGDWRTYFGILIRLPNGAVVDGVTRLISIYKSGTKGVWVLTFNDASSEDFAQFDDPDSAKVAQDVFRNAGYSSAIGNVLAVIVPKAAGGANPETGEYSKVSRDDWWEYFEKHRKAFLESAQFVQVERGEDGIIRKNLTALMHFLFVAEPTASTKTRSGAKRLLEAYSRGYAGTADAWDERRMTKLSALFSQQGSLIHERTVAMPLFTTVLSTLLQGRDIRFNTEYVVNTDTNRKTVVVSTTILKVPKE